MSEVFRWTIERLERRLSSGVVYAAHWTAHMTRSVESGGDLTASLPGSVGFGEPDPDDFIPYEELSKHEVVEWVLDALGEGQIDEICDKLEEQLNAKDSATGVPW